MWEIPRAVGTLAWMDHVLDVVWEVDSLVTRWRGPRLAWQLRILYFVLRMVESLRSEEKKNLVHFCFLLPREGRKTLQHGNTGSQKDF